VVDKIASLSNKVFVYNSVYGLTKYQSNNKQDQQAGRQANKQITQRFLPKLKGRLIVARCQFAVDNAMWTDPFLQKGG